MDWHKKGCVKMYRYGIVVIGYKNETGIRRLLNALQTADYGNNTVLFIISIDKSDNNIIKKIADQFQWDHGVRKCNHL